MSWMAWLPAGSVKALANETGNVPLAQNPAHLHLPCIVRFLQFCVERKGEVVVALLADGAAEGGGGADDRKDCAGILQRNGVGQDADPVVAADRQVVVDAAEVSRGRDNSDVAILAGRALDALRSRRSSNAPGAGKPARACAALRAEGGPADPARL